MEALSTVGPLSFPLSFSTKSSTDEDKLTPFGLMKGDCEFDGQAMNGFVPQGMGWTRDNPDFRDYTLSHPHIAELADGILSCALPKQVDLREYLVEPQDQQSLNASSAFACVALYEYLHARVFNERIEGSPLFVFKMTQRIQRTTGNDGVGLRNTLKAVRRFGVGDRELFPSAPEHLDDEPSGFLVAYRKTNNVPYYVRLDDRNVNGESTFQRTRHFLAAGIPCVCGFPVTKSLDKSGDISFRPTLDGIRGGQAVVITGYDDSRFGDRNGAFQIRSSWGREWGDDGYGWLPYTFVTEQLAVDFWTLIEKACLRSQAYAIADASAI